MERSLRDYGKVNFDDVRIQELVYNIGKSYFFEKADRYSEDKEAEYKLLWNTLSYLQELKEKIEKIKVRKGNIETYLLLEKIVKEKN